MYAIISKNVVDGKHTIERLIHTDIAFTSVEQLQAMPAFADETLDFTMSQVIDVDNLAGDELYNPATGEFEAPPPPRKHILSKLELMQRLTSQEQVLLFFPDDAEGVPAAAKMPLKLFAKQIELANYIDVDREDTVAGLHQLEALGLLGEGRANTIRGLDV